MARKRERAWIQDLGHALRSPLMVCRWHLELLEGDPDARRETVAVVRAELERIDRFLDDVCLLVEADEPDFLRWESIDLELFAHELVAEAGTLANREWKLDRAEGTILGDAHRLAEAVRKLAQTAAQHTAPADLVAIGAGLRDGEGRIWVRDAGGGITAENQARIMEILAGRAEGLARHRGEGFGLAVASAIVAAHGGRLEFESRAGDGSTFTIVVPLGDGGRHGRAQAHSRVGAAPGAPRGLPR